MKTSQLTWIKEYLIENGKISRNYALSRYCSRLGARIMDLKREGWVFNTETVDTVKPDGSKGKDFIYVVVNKP